MECPRKMDYVFNRNLVPVTGVSKSIQKGQLVHVGLHAYWTSRINGDDYQVASIKGLDEAKKQSITFSGLDPESCLEVFQTLIQYFKFIQESLTWIPLFSEQHFKFVAYEDKEFDIRIILTGRIDLGLKTPQIPLIPVDNKSESERWFHSSLSNQYRIYALACKTNILGIQRIGFQRTLKPEDKFKLEIISFDPDSLEEFRTVTLPYWCKQLLLYQEENFYPMNTSSCVTGHFGCQFSDKYNGGICNVSREIREQKIERYFKIGEDWNPSEF
jgi:hypothetical protein